MVLPSDQISSLWSTDSGVLGYLAPFAETNKSAPSEGRRDAPRYHLHYNQITADLYLALSTAITGLPGATYCWLRPIWAAQLPSDVR